MTAKMLEDFNREHFPQVDHMNMRVEHVDDKTITIRMSVTEQHLRPGGTVSGPTMMALADAGMYLLLLAQIGPVALAVTTNLNINFLRKPAPGDIVARGNILKLGKTLATGEISIYSIGIEDPVAHVTLTYAIPPKKQNL
ncbi:PaaI family thioesterase [Sneathiella marina]|uniref:PaaI family thioesterase n=1 Tax=Sneathiella marina TaxID=2950108 RepID=A0ABY4W7W6_9PROT|nr:PaaI family thioesterase [Sneathiella marina]USG63267.1 PaaI family thioesterase [Sneathiella marina]